MYKFEKCFCGSEVSHGNIMLDGEKVSDPVESIGGLVSEAELLKINPDIIEELCAQARTLGLPEIEDDSVEGPPAFGSGLGALLGRLPGRGFDGRLSNPFYSPPDPQLSDLLGRLFGARPMLSYRLCAEIDIDSLLRTGAATSVEVQHPDGRMVEVTISARVVSPLDSAH